MFTKTLPLLATILTSSLLATPASSQQQSKPNILVIFGDDIGVYNISAYHRGMMGGRTPNIDRIATEGALFTDYYAHSRAARPAGLLSSSVSTRFRTGLLTIGMPGAPRRACSELDPDASPTCLKNAWLHDSSGQFGKNHLGDRDEHLPTNHGFDEFYGNLYHLNAEEEPETVPLPEGPGVSQEVRAARRDQIHVRRPISGHRSHDAQAHGDRRRRLSWPMRLDFIERARKAEKPFFVWHNSTRMHVWTRLSEEVAMARPATASTPTAWRTSTTSRWADC